MCEGVRVAVRLVCGRWWVLLLIVSRVSAPAHAQLVSPGKLSAPHAELEGLRRCTDCHRLRERGIANDLCLDCHTDLRTRIAESRGFHATVGDRSCAECHKDHFGEDFALVRLDTAAFDHGEAGFALEGGHRRVACRDCHTASYVRAPDVLARKTSLEARNRTFLGLGAQCVDCHEEDSPHGGRFVGQACEECHVQSTWDEVPGFDHEQTQYPLTGAHRDVECGACHEAPADAPDADARYTGLRFAACSDCHDDPHDGRMNASCESCHQTAGWSQIPRDRFERDFDHAATDYALRGRHAALACTACHSRTSAGRGVRMQFAASAREQTYPTPRYGSCTACHLDQHDGAFTTTPRGGACEDCHTEDGWAPSTFDAARHNAGRTFALVGAHLTAKCAACHEGATVRRPLRVRMPHETCQACHADDDPHRGEFVGRPCDACHVEAAWTPTTFDIARHNAGETFQLAGAHLAAPCSACHGSSVPDAPARFRLAHEACVDCHARDDPHQNQFADRACDECHDTNSYRIERFPHDATRYPLDGRHRDVSCDGCHRLEVGADGSTMRRYRPLGMQCEDCHGGPS